MNSHERYRFYRGYIVVAAAFLLMFMLMGSYCSFGVFIKPLVEQYGWSRAATTSPFAFSWIVGGVAGPILGTLNDKYGPRILFTGTVLCTGAGYLLIPLMTSIYHFYFFYGVMIGFACNIFVPVMSVVARIFTRRRTLMSGIASVGVALGSMVMPPLLTQMLEIWGLNVSFIVLGVAILVIALPAAQFMRQDIREENGEQDTASSIRRKKYLPLTGANLTPGQAMKTVQFWLIFVAVFCLSFGIFVGQVHIIPFLTDIGISAQTASLVLGVISGASIIGRVVLGNSGDRIGNKPAMILGFVLMLAVLLLLIPLTNIWIFFIFAVIYGTGHGSSSTQESPLVASIFGLKSHGVILGLVGIGYALGAAAGPMVAASIFDLTGSYDIAFIITAAMAGLAILLTALLRPVKQLSLQTD